MVAANPTCGVVLLAHGAARSMDGLGPYLEHIRGGRPPSPELLASLQRRYVAIGGTSPLNDITEEVARGLQAELNRRTVSSVPGCRVYVGFRHVKPFAEEVLRAALGDGMSTVLAIPMAPHQSPFVEEGYQAAIDRARAGHGGGGRIVLATPWHMEPDLLNYWATALSGERETVPETARDKTRILFTAHSLPERIMAGSPYREQLEESGRAIAGMARVPRESYSFCFQSATPPGEGWAGPDVRDAIRRASEAGAQGVIVVPQGFLTDHLEVLYDLDIDARRVSSECGMEFRRVPMPNSSPLLIHALANLVKRTLGSVRP